MVHTSVGHSNLENYSAPRRIFTQFCAEKHEGFIFCTLPHEIRLSITRLRTIFLTCDVRLLVRKVCEPNQGDHMIGHLGHVASEKNILTVVQYERLKLRKWPFYSGEYLFKSFCHNSHSFLGM